MKMILLDYTEKEKEGMGKGEGRGREGGRGRNAIWMEERHGIIQ